MKAYHFLFTLMMVNYNYTCLTCGKKIKKNDIPCQAIINKFCIEKLPIQFQTICRLERVLVSRRILFNKISIMLKDQSS